MIYDMSDGCRPDKTCAAGNDDPVHDTFSWEFNFYSNVSRIRKNAIKKFVFFEKSSGADLLTSD
jgi:hypothetical protein